MVRQAPDAFLGNGRSSEKKRVDLRAKPGEPTTSVAEDAKETTASGKVSLFVTDEDLEGERAYLVVVGSDGSILAQREVTIGQNR
ncbi:MAG: hypothetical protein R6T99_00600 [Bacteroidales bacterium]